MIRKKLMTLVTFLLLGALPLPYAWAANGNLVIKDASELEFKELIQGTSQAMLYSNGDENGPYGSVTKFAAGTKHGPHTHTYDVKAIIIKGTFIFEADGVEKKLGPGSYISIPGGKVHSSSAGNDEEVVFLQLGQHPFDIHFQD